jgi:capsular exopolysaccharide synthesis family protein
MGRIYEAFKRAERDEANRRAPFNALRESAVPSRVVGFNRPQSNDDGLAQHAANADALERLTSREEEHYVEHLMRERAARRRESASEASMNDARADDERIVPFVARRQDAAASAKQNSALHSANGALHSQNREMDGAADAIQSNAASDSASPAANGASSAARMAEAAAQTEAPSAHNDASRHNNAVSASTAPPALSSEDAREARRRRIAEALQSARPSAFVSPINGKAANGASKNQAANAGAAVSVSDAKVADGDGAIAQPIYASPDVELPAQLFKSSRYFKSPHDKTLEDSASAERIEDISAEGTALPVGVTSRAAGATADVGGATRAVVNFPEVQTMEISPARVEPHLVAIIEPQSPNTERFRALRTRVLHAGEKRGMKSFVVTSANPSEGKTLTALNLAWLLAQTEGARALLIDGDLRQPCVADYLDIEPLHGLSEVLAGQCSLSEAMVNLQPAGLYLLSGGGSQIAREQVAELFSGPTFNKVLQEARAMFDYIIIDAPPLAIFTDASLLINRADGALLVVRAGKTRYAALDRLLEPLPRERILGVVLNGSDEPMNESNYYYYKRREET